MAIKRKEHTRLHEVPNKAQTMLLTAQNEDCVEDHRAGVSATF